MLSVLPCISPSRLQSEPRSRFPPSPFDFCLWIEKDRLARHQREARLAVRAWGDQPRGKGRQDSSSPKGAPEAIHHSFTFLVDLSVSSPSDCDSIFTLKVRTGGWFV